ncbi:MAG: YdcH family protein [Alphaproteobacteria bacterium]
MTAKNKEETSKLLVELKTEHRDLDDIINNLVREPSFDQIQLHRLKKRKLFIKDQISKIENNMLPDIIA